MSKTRALLCEDEQDAREILGFYLETIFEEVVIAKDGREGLRQYKKYRQENHPFDLVLTDLKMPGMDGMSMLEAIHDIDPDQKFIIVSAYRDEDKLHRSLDLKVLGYFLKPLNVDNIMGMLRKAKDEVLRQKSKQQIISKIFTYNGHKRLLYRNGRIVKLSPQETLVLNLLMQHRGTIVQADQFKMALWNTTEKSDSTFRAIMKRLKDKLEEDDFVQSYKGQGYMVE